MLKFHQRVQTPNGPGIIQGWMAHRNDAGQLEHGKIIVSHDPMSNVNQVDKLSLTAIRGIWTLAAYEVNEIKELK